jgi:hypothetical protein
MPEPLLQGLLKIGGVSALALGIFYLLYRQVLGLRIFAKMSQVQTFVMVGLVVFLVWSTAMTALVMNDSGVKALIFGSGNTVIQGAVVK